MQFVLAQGYVTWIILKPMQTRRSPLIYTTNFTENFFFLFLSGSINRVQL